MKILREIHGGLYFVAEDDEGTRVVTREVAKDTLGVAVFDILYG